MANIQRMVDDLTDIDNYIWTKEGYTHRPSGRDYMLLVLEIAEHIAYRSDFSVDDITDEVQEILTNDNFHTLNTAIDVVKWLYKRA